MASPFPFPLPPMVYLFVYKLARMYIPDQVLAKNAKRNGEDLSRVMNTRGRVDRINHKAPIGSHQMHRP